jgi:hypothetical protein
MGSYTAGGRTIYKVRLDNIQVHIVDGCWQIKMMDYSEGQNKAHFDFSEVRPGLFLLSKSNAQLYIDRKKWPNGYISMQMTYSYFFSLLLFYNCKSKVFILLYQTNCYIFYSFSYNFAHHRTKCD